MSANELTHLNQDGTVRMVDVGEKPLSKRSATAKSHIRMSDAAAEAIRREAGESLPSDPSTSQPQPRLRKGDCLAVSRIAAIQATKSTPQWIPLCHIVPLDGVHVSHTWIAPNVLEWSVEVSATWRTGVEMEAMAGATAAALTTYDMVKAIDRSIEITHIALWHKTGGRSGDYIREN